jgi:hypothetical protein
VLPKDCCCCRPPGAGRGRARASSARGSICACCPCAHDLVSSPAISSSLAKTLARTHSAHTGRHHRTISPHGVRGRAASVDPLVHAAGRATEPFQETRR